MLGDRNAYAIAAVRDIERARDFYADVLGLELLKSSDSVLNFKTGDTLLTVYRSQEAGSNRANAVVWSCGEDIERIVADLEAKGVVFEHYPGIGGSQMQGNIHVAGNAKLVWFKDPDGNILHLNNF
jgi:catechol 2,3-dioxygenase-like lactoylglutathione lyase family enzyme